MLIPKDVTGAKIPRRVERIGRMHFPTVVASIDDTAGIPEGPSRDWGSVAQVVGVGFEEVESIGRILVDASRDESKQDEQDSSGDEDEGSKGDGRPCLFTFRGYFTLVGAGMSNLLGDAMLVGAGSRQPSLLIVSNLPLTGAEGSRVPVTVAGLLRWLVRRGEGDAWGRKEKRRFVFLSQQVT